jgi:hypothetical protein
MSYNNKVSKLKIFNFSLSLFKIEVYEKFPFNRKIRLSEQK